MTPFTKLSLFIICSMWFTEYSHGQAVSVSFGPLFTHTRQTVPMIHSREDFSNTDYAFAFTYEHFLNKRPISLFGSFYTFKGYAFIKYSEGSVILRDGYPLTGSGFSGVNIYRYDVGMNYNLIPHKRKFYFKVLASLGLQQSRQTGIEIYNALAPIEGPDYYQLEPISAESLNTLQVLPTLGFRTGFVFWNRLDIGLSVLGVYGFRPYQRMFFKYTYRGVPQETAVFEASGTGVFAAIGVGFRFIKTSIL